jgi:hypothetical protein
MQVQMQNHIFAVADKRPFIEKVQIFSQELRYRGIFMDVASHSISSAIPDRFLPSL